MRKSRHFIKNLAKKINVYVVVFVALVNACFYCPEVQAADVGDSQAFIGTWSSSSLYIDSGSITSYGEFKKNFISSDALNAFFEVGHTYRVTGWVYSYVSGTSSVSSDYSSANWYFPGDDGEIFLCGSQANDYYSKLDFTFVYQGQNPGLVCRLTLRRLSTSSTSSIPSGYGSIVFHEDYPFTFTDLGVVSSEYDILERIDDTTTKTYETIQENLIEEQKQTDVLNEMKDGYDDSAGNQAAADLDNSASGYESVEDSIFTSSKSSLEGFEFFDFNSIPAVVTGLSFITTTATAIFDAMGGTSGAGIVLSVLFAVMFVSIVIGLYRYFK